MFNTLSLSHLLKLDNFTPKSHSSLLQTKSITNVILLSFDGRVYITISFLQASSIEHCLCSSLTYSQSMELFSKGRWRLESAQVISCCVYEIPTTLCKHMHGNFPYMFDYWADPVLHLLLLKRSKQSLTFSSLSLSSSSSYLAQISFGGWRFLKQKQRAIYLDMPPATSLPFMSKTYSADWVLKQRFYVFQFGIITKFHDSVMFQKIAKWANFWDI